MKSQTILFAVFILLGLTQAYAQSTTYNGFPSLVWPKLYDISFEKAKDDLGEYDKPIFSPSAKALNGKTVTIPGYMVPSETSRKESHFMLSSMPLNACFFCGVGGPETVVEVFLKAPIAYTEKPVQIRGVLRLNANDPDKMIYLLENAEVEGIVED